MKEFQASNSVKVILDGEGEMQKIEISDRNIKRRKIYIEDLIVAAHNNAKVQLKTKTQRKFQRPQVDLVFQDLSGRL